MTELEEIWLALSEEETPQPGDVHRRLPSAAGVDIFLTHSRPARRAGFTVVVDEAPGTLWRQLRSSQGLTVTMNVRGSKPSLTVQERETGFHAVFSAMVADLVTGLEVLADRTPPGRPLLMDFLAGRIARWQVCLREEREGLSEEKQAGLFGELHVLGRLLEAGLPALPVV